jgi:hypothetical protein
MPHTHSQLIKVQKHLLYIYDIDLWSSPSGVWGTSMMQPHQIGWSLPRYSWKLTLGSGGYQWEYYVGVVPGEVCWFHEKVSWYACVCKGSNGSDLGYTGGRYTKPPKRSRRSVGRVSLEPPPLPPPSLLHAENEDSEAIPYTSYTSEGDAMGVYRWEWDIARWTTRQ